MCELQLTIVSIVVGWDHNDYTIEPEKQLSNSNVYDDVSFNEKNLQDLVRTSSELFQNLRSKEKISDKQLRCFTYEYKKVCNIEKVYLSRKIHKRLHKVPWRHLILNRKTPTENASAFSPQNHYARGKSL